MFDDPRRALQRAISAVALLGGLGVVLALVVDDIRGAPKQLVGVGIDFSLPDLTDPTIIADTVVTEVPVASVATTPTPLTTEVASLAPVPEIVTASSAPETTQQRRAAATTVAPPPPQVAEAVIVESTTAPTTESATTTTVAPTTVVPTTVVPTTVAPTTVAPTTVAPTTTDCIRNRKGRCRTDDD